MSQTSEGMEQTPEEKISLDELLLLLDLDAVALHTNRKETLQYVFLVGSSMCAEAQKRAKWLLGDKRISQWYHSTRSQTILINGHGSLKRTTPMSLFCAMVRLNLYPFLPTDKSIVLTHFCGLQILDPDLQDPKEQKASGLLKYLLTQLPVQWKAPKEQKASGLLKDLLRQLLLQWKDPDITGLEHDFLEKLKEKGSNWSSKQQWHLLRHLVAALPPTTCIFIFIDGIDYYDPADWCEDTKEEVKQIYELLSAKGGAKVKICITSITRPSKLTRYFKNHEVINVPEDMDGIMPRFSPSRFEGRLCSKLRMIKDWKGPC